MAGKPLPSSYYFIGGIMKDFDDLTKEELLLSGRNYRKTKKFFNLKKGYVLHHVDETLRHNDAERYIEWRPEDLIVMTNEEHARLHFENSGINWRGKHLTKEHREKIGKSNKGKVITMEQRIKISNTLKGKYTGKNAFNHKPVRCIETGEIFDGARDIKKIYPNACMNTMSECCNGRRNKHLGFHWEFVK